MAVPWNLPCERPLGSKEERLEEGPWEGGPFVKEGAAPGERKKQVDQKIVEAHCWRKIIAVVQTKRKLEDE